jgi:rhodanese-related sulfurtransferase
MMWTGCGSQAAPGSSPTTVDEVPRITVRELNSRLDAGHDVTVVDTRAPANYDEEHLPGALSIPLSEIEERGSELPRTGLIVLY